MLTRVRSALGYACIAVLSGLLYANTLGAELVYDDHVWVPGLGSLSVPWDPNAIARPVDTLFRPLTVWSLMLNFDANQALGLPGAHTAGYHVVNILLHASAGCVLLRLLLALGLSAWAALATAALFVAHPIQTESVASILNRSEPLAALFGFAFLLLHRRRRWLPASLCYLLAMASKESAVAFLPIAVAMDLCLGTGGRPAWLGWGLHAAAMIVWLVARALAIGGAEMDVGFLSNPLFGAPALERVLTAGGVQLDYVARLILPIGLSADHSFDQVPIVHRVLEPRFLGFVALVAAAAACAWVARRRHPLVAFGILGYAISFAPTSNLAVPIGTILAERLAYAPSAFFLLLVGYGLQAAHARFGSWASAFACAVVLVLGWLTVERNRTWRDEQAFYTALVESAPRNALAHYGVAFRVYEMQGRLDEAVAAYLEAVEIYPEYLDAWNNLAVVYRTKGDLDTALATYEHLLGLSSSYARGWFGMGEVLGRKDERERATTAYETAIRLDPRYYQAYTNLGRLQAEAGRIEEAERSWRRALEIQPGYPPAVKNLEILRAKTGR